MLYILFDSNSVAWRSRFNHNLNDKHDYIVVKGFLYNILSTTLKLGIPNVIFAWDTPNGESKRKELFPDYKNRHEDKSEEELRLDDIARFQMSIIQDKVLPDMGFKNIFSYTGLEGDDVVASIINNYPNDKFVVVSSDKDLWQLIGPNCVQTFIDTDELLNYKLFVSRWNINPNRWGEIKSIVGCDTDKVPGIKGVAEKTAVKYLNNILPENSVKYKSIISEEGKKIIERNKPLVMLPFEGTPVPEIKQDNLDVSTFKNTFKKYGLYDFIPSAMLDKFCQAFKMQSERDVF